MQPNYHLPQLERLHDRAYNKIHMSEISIFHVRRYWLRRTDRGEPVIAQGHVMRQGPLYIQSAIESSYW